MIFDVLKKYSLTADKINTVTFLDFESVKKSKKVLKSLKTYSFFTTNLDDKLFWYYYIFINGHDTFKLVKNYFLEEKASKIKLIQKIRENKSIMKKMKIKRNEVEDELLNQETIKIKTFLLLCAIEKKNILIKDNYKYLEYINDIDNSNIEVIEKIQNGYGLYIFNKKEQIDLCREKSFKIITMNFEKPLRAISNYKVGDLKDIIKKLNIQIENKLRKKDLYELILLKLK